MSKKYININKKEIIEKEFYKNQEQLELKFAKIGNSPYFSEDYIEAYRDLRKEKELNCNGNI